MKLFPKYGYQLESDREDTKYELETKGHVILSKVKNPTYGSPKTSLVLECHHEDHEQDTYTFTKDTGAFPRRCPTCGSLLIAEVISVVNDERRATKIARKQIKKVKKAFEKAGGWEEGEEEEGED